MTISEFFSKDGPLSKAFKNYETRDGQVLLSRHIAKVFRDSGIGLYEAGTGIGKSLAYLYPSYLRSKESGKPVVISTTTNNLLSQLLYKDLPLLKSVLNDLGEDISFVGIKGKTHYACHAKMDGSIDPMISDLIQDISNTPNGERSELEYQIYDEDWRKVNYDRETCAGVKCPFFKDCYITNIKKRAEKANIIVTNHNIIFAEKLAKFQILPEYEDLVLDEGHNIEGVATDYLTENLYLSQISSLSKDIFLNDGRGQSGMALISKLKDYFEDFVHISEDLIRVKDSLYNYIFQKYYNSDEDFIISDREELIINLTNLKKTCEKIIQNLAGIELENERHQLMINTVFNTSNEFLDWIKNIEDPGLLIWGKIKNDEIYLFQTPLNIGDLLQREIYSKLHSTIIVSATLTVNRSFDFIKTRLGIGGLNADGDKINVNTNVFKSPFNYEKQMKLNIREDIPDQKSVAYLEKIADAIVECVKETNGNAFVLFTSYSNMKDVADMIEDELKELEIPLLVQEGGNREEIVKNFKEGGSVLMGVESFWEGVDIPGEALSHVIIVKLPFKVPSTPIEKARAEDVEKNGGNSFYNLSLPQAVIKFRQGVGRLIRTSDDMGIITILDPRIISSSYGKIFMNEIRS